MFQCWNVVKSHTNKQTAASLLLRTTILHRNRGTHKSFQSCCCTCACLPVIWTYTYIMTDHSFLHSSLDKSSSSAGQSSPAHSRASSAERQRDTVERLSQPRHSSHGSPSARRAWGSPARPDSRGAASDVSRRRPASPQLHRPQSGIAGVLVLPMRPPPLATLVL